MIRCAICKSRVRPPERAWAETGDRHVVNFYRTAGTPEQYAEYVAGLAKKVPFVHEDCLDAAPGGMVSWPYMVALNLDKRLRFAKLLRDRPDIHPEIPERRSA
jgi:hypothetical protein